MKRLIIIPFLFIYLILSGANHYVKNGGSDAASGADDANAWETISKVNGHSFAAGDSVFFKRGDKFIGTLTPSSTGTAVAYITYGAYGTGAKPIITPNDTIAGISWSAYGGSGIYSTTDIGYNPENILINWEGKALKINDWWLTHTPADSRYGNLGAMALMAVPASQTYTINYISVYFWDGIEAMYCYNSATGTTYFRFRDGEDPSDSTLAIAVAGSSAVYVNAKRYTIIQNLHLIGGRYGVDLAYNNYTDTSNVIIENCYIESSNEKVYIHAASNGITVRNDTITNIYLSSYKPGAWYNAGTYTGGVRRHYYEFAKYRISLSESGEADAGIYHGGGLSPNDKFYNNTILDCINGITVYGDDTEVYDNYISGTSSSGIYIGQACDSSVVHDNYIVNSNICFRIGSLNDDAYPRTFYIYKNRCYIPSGGSLFFLHYDPPAYHPINSLIEAYVYHNSFIMSNGIDVSGYAVADTVGGGGTGIVFVDNIFSVSGNNTTGYSTIWTQENLFEFYYNWISGRYYYAVPSSDTAIWAEDLSNIYHYNHTFWTHATNPPTYAIEGTEVIDVGIDVSVPFVLGGVNYSALPGIGTYSGTASDLGYYEFQTGAPPVIPSVSTKATTGITISKATGHGDVTYEGERTVTDRGVCWGTSANPTIAGSHSHSGSGLGAFTSTITGLSGNTTYHVRAFATNVVGTGYGVDLTFTTPKYTDGFIKGKVGFIKGKRAVIY